MTRYPHPLMVEGHLSPITNPYVHFSSSHATTFIRGLEL